MSRVGNDDQGRSDQVRTLLHPCGRCVKRVRASTDCHKSCSCGKNRSKSTESSPRSDHSYFESLAPTHGTWRHRSMRILGILALEFPLMPQEGRIRMLHGDGDSLSSSVQGLTHASLYMGDLANHSGGCRHAGASVHQHRCIVPQNSLPTSCDSNWSYLKVFFVVFHSNMPICIDPLATRRDLQCHESVGWCFRRSLHLQAGVMQYQTQCSDSVASHV